MECEAAQQLIDDREHQGALAAHLEGCTACRAEAEFRQGVAAAVAAMPRARAPEGLAERVMAEVRERPEVARPAARFPQLALRPWEMGWVSALCLALLALIAAALGGWAPPGALASASIALREWAVSLRVMGAASLWETNAWPQELAGLWRTALEQSATPARAASSLLAVVGGYPAGVWLTGLGAAAAFAVGFYLLLSWRAGGGGMQTTEDAHA